MRRYMRRYERERLSDMYERTYKRIYEKVHERIQRGYVPEAPDTVGTLRCFNWELRDSFPAISAGFSH